MNRTRLSELTRGSRFTWNGNNWVVLTSGDKFITAAKMDVGGWSGRYVIAAGVVVNQYTNNDK